ncbi:MAG: hypothetical protein NVS3B26_10480 [Mycobacteriales bacterium]
MFTSRRLTVAAATAAALTLTGYAVAQATGASATTTTNTPSAAGAATAVGAALAAPLRRQHRFLTPTERAELRATGHTTVVRHTRKHGDVTLTVQVGRITAVSPTAITVVSRSRYGRTYALVPGTVVKDHRRTVGMEDLTLGDRVLVVATPAGPARRIFIRRSAGAHTSAPVRPTA